MGVRRELSYISASPISQLVNSCLSTSQMINDYELSRVRRREMGGLAVAEEGTGESSVFISGDHWVLTLGEEKGGRIYKAVFKVPNSMGNHQNQFSLKVF